MQLLVVLAALTGVLLSVRAAAVLPVEERSPVHLNRVSRRIHLKNLFPFSLKMSLSLKLSVSPLLGDYLFPVTAFHSHICVQELSKERKELILKLVSGLLDGALDTNMLPMETVDLEEPLESRLEERAVYNRLSLPQRDRKAPCKNFFWKTFTSC